MSSNAEPITSVTIFNQTYMIKSGDDPAYVKALAGIVDRRMNELSRQTPTVDTLKVAILAAMYLADDLQKAKRQIDGYSAEVKSKVQLMFDRLEASLGYDDSRSAPKPER